MAILSVRQADGTWVEIPALVGPRGDSGVYVGTDNPPKTAIVWINPNGEPAGTEDWEFDLDDGSTDTKQVVVLNSDESSGQLAALRFKQADGTWVDIPAIKGSPGEPGYTPQKGKDYFDGAKGDPGYTPVKGVDYNDGEPGVYVGSDTPPDSAKVWVNPTGEPTNTEAWEFDMDDGSIDTKQVVVVNSDEATANGVLGILKVRQEDGTWKEIPALVGGKGDPGYTPQKGKDYFDGAKGDPGTSVTIESISESTTDGGSNVVTFSDNKTLTIKNGSKGSDASVTSANIEKALGFNISTQLNKKANDFSIEIYNGTSGNPKPVKFASFNYSACDSENGIAAKISLVSGHGNGSSYAFLEDAILKVNYQGGVAVDNFKYYGVSVGTYDGASRQYGDIFWVVDTTNKIVDFYCLMGQYARMYQTPWKRLTYSSKGTVTQYTSANVYSEGEKVWANNSEIALISDIPTTAEQLGALPLAGGTMTGELRVNGGDAAGGSKIVLETGKGQITASNTATLFGYTAASTLAVGHSTAVLAMRGSGTRPKYNSADLALKSDIPTVTKETWTFTLENGSTVTKVVHIG